MKIFTLIIFIITSIGFIYYLIREIQEIYFLKKILKNIIGKVRIDSVDDLINIKNYLNKNISYNSDLKNKKRPLLRHSATQILTSNYGFCGENTRVAIKLLLIGGIKARRIYLFRKEWQHVLIEHRFKDKWFMFDGHYDEYTVLKDQDIASIPTEDIYKYPDNYDNNPYLNYCRIKLFYRIPILRLFSKLKLHSIIIYLFESPFLIKALIILLLTFLIIISIA